mgnify:CR=1 FL=1
MRNRSQTPKAVQEVKRRKKNFINKRFNNPLRIFVERKYPEIFTEYKNMYNHMDFQEPKRKNLVNSRFFKEWMTENPLPSVSLLPLHSSVDVSSSTPPQPPTRQINITETTLPEVFEPLPQIDEGPVEQEQPNVSGLHNSNDVAEAIINEVVENYFLRELLEGNAFDEDEGIELNHIDEILNDIEPFDFDLDLVDLY